MSGRGRRSRRIVVFICLVSSFIVFGLVPGGVAAAQSLDGGHPRPRITSEVDDNNLVVLKGNHPAAAMPQLRIGAASPDTAMEKMILVLKPDADRQRSLDGLVDAQRDPKSASYRQWLTPEEYAARFGVAEEDIAQVVTWLERQGFTVDEIPTGRRTILFSGTVRQVSAAFHTEMARYSVGGKIHLANATDPQIPRALAPVVEGVVSLHDFRSAPLHRRPQPLFSKPQWSSGGEHYLSPADYATIYDVAPLYSQGFTGAGQAIAVVARTNLNLSDVAMFRSTFGLPAKAPIIVLNGANPGIADEDDLDETTLDTEWPGAVAPSATVDVVVSKSTATSDGVYLSAQYAVNHNVAPVLSVSYGLCEADLGQAENSFLSSLWQQAAAEGITVLVASGDEGAAGCDAGSESRATGGRAVNGLCSTAYDTCVGGTEFSEGANASQYWSGTNSSMYGSALGYIPEAAWNESASGGLWATGGGASGVYAKPAWQSGLGVPADGMRDVPDVALTAAGHDGYLICIHGSVMVISGTSAAAPSFAGLMGLVLQSTGAPQGNVNPILYALAARQELAGGAAVFHDITTGNNSVPGVTGFNAGAGYDQATGLGSVDANLLVTHWNDGGTAPAVAVSLGSGTAMVTAGKKVTVTVTTTVSGGFAKAITLSATGLPSGVTASFSPATFASPGAGQSTLTLTATTALVASTYTVNIVAASGGMKKTVPLTLEVQPAPGFTLAIPSALMVTEGNSTSGQVSVSLVGTFNAAVALRVSGMPMGMTATFSTATIAAPGAGSTSLNIVAASTVAPGTYALTIAATGNGLAKTATLKVTVAGFTLTSSTPAVILHPGLRTSITVRTTAGGGFNSPLSLAVSGLPTGVTATVSPTSIAAPGTGSAMVTLSAASTVTSSTARITVTASGGGVTKTLIETVSLANR